MQVSDRVSILIGVAVVFSLAVLGAIATFAVVAFSSLPQSALWEALVMMFSRR
jgi:hypothetical protein